MLEFIHSLDWLGRLELCYSANTINSVWIIDKAQPLGLWSGVHLLHFCRAWTLESSVIVGRTNIRSIIFEMQRAQAAAWASWSPCVGKVPCVCHAVTQDAWIPLASHDMWQHSGASPYYEWGRKWSQKSILFCSKHKQPINGERSKAKHSSAIHDVHMV